MLGAGGWGSPKYFHFFQFQGNYSLNHLFGTYQKLTCIFNSFFFLQKPSFPSQSSCLVLLPGSDNCQSSKNRKIIFPWYWWECWHLSETHYKILCFFPERTSRTECQWLHHAELQIVLNLDFLPSSSVVRLLANSSTPMTPASNACPFHTTRPFPIPRLESAAG